MASGLAVSKEGLSIPLIDFSRFLSGTPVERNETANAILDGFKTAGFIYLKNHPILPKDLQHAFDLSARFFNEPLEKKMEVAWTTPEANRGYSAPGREKVSQLKDIQEVEKVRAALPDLKESLEIGREDEPGHPNRWLEETGDLVGFRKDMLRFFEKCRQLHVEVMKAIAVGMGLDDRFFDSFVDVGDNTLRLLHYPAVDSNIFKTKPGTVRAGAHSDYGSITLLFQDARGGLQVKSPTGEFVDATPIEGTVVVNAGDLLARWSNDTIKSTIHRVVEPPQKQAEAYPPRYSIAYFCNPNFKSYIEAIPGTFITEKDKKYEGSNFVLGSQSLIRSTIGSLLLDFEVPGSQIVAAMDSNTPTAKRPLKQEPSTANKAYLIFYNFISAVQWSVVLGRTAMLASAYGPEYVYPNIGQYTKWTQTLAGLEVLHSMLGVVRASFMTTLMQVASRFLLVWAIVDVFPFLALSPFYSSMLVAWSVTEIIRYSFFVLSLCGYQPKFLTWLRYNTFFVLYPIGICSECILIWFATEPAGNINELYKWALYAILVIYVPGSYVLYTHLMSQRRKVMRNLKTQGQKAQ
ncbi:gibberellin 20-oxidase [Fusarium subglutinans]|uniref:Very-long-chain (3R)-3-hydroxyacyl-CoA dehydratase n=1 Tax=Gibberella subglutinans TaxID=42677 RepID=A0A8H5L9W6_GIBSU|nr:gibberellin 20-oxidase [Fusarium subglutinans]KAF5586490.1 gibberellin 20-oxidase [Fusarium subglutinans]